MWGCGSSELERRAQPRGESSGVRDNRQHEKRQSQDRSRPYDNGTHTCARRGLDVRAVPDESGAAVEANARSSLTDSVRCRGDHGDHDAGCCICCQNTAAPLGCMLLGRGRRTVPLRSLHGSTSPIKLEGEVAPGRASVSLAFGSSTHKRAWHRP